MVVVGLVTAAWAAPGAWARSSDGGRVTGDEPQYLMSAISLGEDGDLDIADERAERRWEPFHEAGPPSIQTERQPDGRRVSPHDPLLPALLAGPVRVGGWLGARLALAALAGALAASMLWVAVRRLGVSLRTAVTGVGVLSLGAPLAVYATQVYPELPAALVTTLGVGALLGRPSVRTTTGLVLAVVALPWLSVKYAPVAAALAGVGLAVLVRRGHRRLAAGALLTLAVAGVAYLAAHQAWYGGWTVYAAGDHFRGDELSVMGRSPDYWGRGVRLVGLLVDRGFGLAAWQPAFLLAVPAVAALLRRRPAGWPALAAPLAAGWLTATFAALTMHGWWWPGRQVVVVLPVLVVTLAWWADGTAARRRLVAVVGALGLLTVAVLVGETLAGRLTVVVDFEQTVAPVHRALRPLLPDYRTTSATTWALHGAWVLAISALAAAGWRSAAVEGSGAPAPSGITRGGRRPRAPRRAARAPR